MKKLLFLFLLLPFLAHSQGSARYNMVVIDGGLYLATYGDTADVTIQKKTGLMILDTAGSNKGLYVYLDKKFTKIGEGGGGITNVQAPLYLINPTTAGIFQAGIGSDGILSAEDYERMDSATRHWRDTLTDAMRPKRRSIYGMNEFYSLPSGFTADDGNTTWMFVRSGLQTFIAGGRSAAARYKSGVATGTENTLVGEWAGNSAITTAALNAYFGKAGGYNLSTGSRNAEFGAHRLNNSTGDDNSSLGFGISAFTAFIGSRNISLGSGVLPSAFDASDEFQAGFGGTFRWLNGRNSRLGVRMPSSLVPQEALHVNGKVKIDSIDAIANKDSLLVPDNGVIKKMVMTKIVTVTTSSTLVMDAAISVTVKTNATSGPITHTLPAASSCPGKIFWLKKTDSSSNAMIVTTSEGLQSIDTQNGGIGIQSDGTIWFILSSF